MSVHVSTNVNSIRTGELLGGQRNSQCQQTKDQSCSFNSLYKDS